MRTHQLIDARSLAFGQAIVEKLRLQPDLVTHAQANIERWMKTTSPGAQRTLQEWKEVLDGPLEGVIDLLTNPGERATLLRQSNPFAGVLSPSERNAIIREFQARDIVSGD